MSDASQHVGRAAVTPIVLSEDEAIEAVSDVLRQHMHPGRVWYATAKVLDALGWPRGSESARLTAALADVVAMAHREADAGAPAGMVAVYVEIALRHLSRGHDGPWANCSPCHADMSTPVDLGRADAKRLRDNCWLHLRRHTKGESFIWTMHSGWICSRCGHHVITGTSWSGPR